MRRYLVGLVALVFIVLSGGQAAYASPAPPQNPASPAPTCSAPADEPSGSPSPQATKRTIVGTVRLVAIDRPGCPDRQRLVLLAGGKSYTLKGAAAAQARPNSKMRVAGSARGNNLTVDKASTIAAAPGLLATRGTTRVLVMLAYWTQPDGLTPAAAQAQIFDEDNRWYREASYGQLGQTGVVTPWMRIDGPAGGECFNDSGSTMAQAKTAAEGRGYVLNNYDNFILYFPNNDNFPGDDCAGTAGFAYVGAPDTWLNGYMDLRVTVHEQGHNYGLNHANSNFCVNADLAGTCDVEEYGDPYDAMGGGFEDVGHFNVYSKDRLDWFDDRTPAADLTAGGTRTIVPLESSASGIPGVKVTASARRTYWLDYRQPLGFDSGLPAAATTGVLVHTVDQSVADIQEGTSIIDAYPNAGDQTASLQIRAGSSWTSPEGYTFSVSSAGASGAVVGVTKAVGYRALDPARLLDTRSGNGAPKKIVPAGGRVDLTVLGRGGVPLTGVSSVLVNLTVTQGVRGGYATAYPTGVAQPAASTLNFPANRSVANSVIVKIGTAGRISIATSATAHLIIDVQGYFQTGSDLVGLTPTRILDTRSGTGAPVGIVKPATPVALQVLGVGGVPSSGVTSVIINVTATQGATRGISTVYPTGGANPATSTVSYDTRQSVATGTVAKIGAGGKITLAVSADVHLIVDVQGYFTSDADVRALPPARVFDTRTNPGTAGGLVANQKIELAVLNKGGVPSSGVEAVVLNVTADPGSRGGVLTVFPGGSATPTTSTLNFPPSIRTSNSTIVKLGPGGTVAFVPTAGTHLTVDVVGYVPTLN